MQNAMWPHPEAQSTFPSSVGRNLDRMSIMSSDDHKRQAFQYWKYEADRQMHLNYAVGLADAGIDDEDLRMHWEGQSSASDMVEWIARKYDLTHVRALPASSSAMH